MNEIIELVFITRELVKGHYEPAESKKTVFAEVKSPTRSEFYQAYQSGMKASAVFKVYTAECKGAEFVIHNGTRYKIERAYMVDVDRTELTCSEVV